MNQEYFMDARHKAAQLIEGATLLPFSGLGHDLAPVMERAALLIVVPARQTTLIPPGYAPRTWVPYGYELLVVLGRETRGR